MALTDPVGGGASLKRLAFLLELGPPTCPPETFANLLLLCCKHEMYDTAADILAEHTHLTYKYLSPVSLSFVVLLVGGNINLISINSIYMISWMLS